MAQKAFDRPINAASFEDWLEQCLVPTLSQGDVVVMDNLSSHKGPRVEQLIKAAGAELRYLPPYSPDMNPIEKAYSKLKALPALDTPCSCATEPLCQGVGANPA